MSTYILNKPGPNVVGSSGSTNDQGRMIWTAQEDALTIDGDVLPALARMAEVLGDPMTARDTGGHFSCMEAEALADVLIAAGHDDAARVWLDGHAQGDDDPDDMHYRGEPS